MSTSVHRRKRHDVVHGQVTGPMGVALVARALALPEAVVARPTGVGRAISTYSIPIEGRDEWLAAAGLRA